MANSESISQSLGVLTEREPSEQSFKAAARVVFNYAIAEYGYYGVRFKNKSDGGEQFERNLSRILEALRRAHLTLSGLTDPSAFKVAAAFTVHLIATNPFEEKLPDSVVGYLADKPTALLAFQMCCAFLKGVKIHRRDGKKKILRHPIKVSEHYIEELVRTLWDTFASFEDLSIKLGQCYSNVRRSVLLSQQIRLVALIYEAIAYQTNPRVPYPTFTRLPYKQGSRII